MIKSIWLPIQISAQKVTRLFLIFGIDRAAKNGLNQSFKYIILAQEEGEGVYSPKLNSKISFMPSFAKHGYSKGIAYSDKDKIVIYWLIFW